ncbi:YidH family protein [Saccharopolyspora hattusasensis]|uniref:YidH family protein n=1 Tax=Saccharopolyspora hattusasensis TaxID=1128679 RepID=UPI003D98988F
MATDPEDRDSRWPRRLYRDGSDPDPRFTLANERTFLAWIRTALALMAGGVGIEALNAATGQASPLRTALAVLLLLGGVLCSATAFARWIATERALRRGRPLPAPRLAPVIGYGLGAIGIAACVLLFVSGF